MSGWLRDSQAHIVFWFGISLVFGMTRRIVRVIVPGRWLPGKQFQGTSFFLVFSCCIPAAWDNNPNNCSLCCLGCCWGFGIRGSGFGVSGSGIGIYVYIPLFIYILSIIFLFFRWQMANFRWQMAKITRIIWDFVGFFTCDINKFMRIIGINKKKKVRNYDLNIWNRNRNLPQFS